MRVVALALSLRDGDLKKEDKMLYRIVVFYSTWIAISAFGGFLIQSVIETDFGPMMVILVFLTFFASLVGANKVADLFESWQRKRGFTTKRSTRIVQSKVLFALGVALVAAGVVYDLSETPLKGLGLPAGLVFGLHLFTFAVMIHPNAADRLYNWLLLNTWLGRALFIAGSIVSVLYYKHAPMTFVYGLIVAISGLLTLGLTVAGRKKLNH